MRRGVRKVVPPVGGGVSVVAQFPVVLPGAGGQRGASYNKGNPVLFSFCMTCMGRAGFVKQTIGASLECARTMPGCEIVLLNYNSRDGLHDYIMLHHKDAISKGLLKYHHTKEPQSFQASKAKNVAHLLGSGEYLVNLDADNILTSDYYHALKEQVDAGMDVVAMDREAPQPHRGAAGRIAIRRGAFHAVGGYDEHMCGYGWEDFDLVHRARSAGFATGQIDYRLAEHLSHGDELRTVNMEMGGSTIRESIKRNLDGFTEMWSAGRKTANDGVPWGVLPGDLGKTEEPEVTLVIANWKRPDQIHVVFDSVPAGTKLFLLDNAHEGFTAYEEDVKRADWYLRSNNNNLFLRWVMASQAQTKFVVVHDDDLIVKDWEPYLKHLRDPDNLGMTGVFGANLKWSDPANAYARAEHSFEGGMYDLICGRVTFARTADLQKARLFGFEDHRNIAEDIAVASLFDCKHHVPHAPGNVVELGSPHSSYGHFAHTPSRQCTAERLLVPALRNKRIKFPHKAFGKASVDASRLAVITSHFNFTRSEALRNNLLRFKGEMEDQGMPLYGVEAYMRNEIPFTAGWRNWQQIPVGRESLLWQKEALLNIAETMVPEEHDLIAWIDADVSFDNACWAEMTVYQLGHYKVVQMFETGAYLYPDGSTDHGCDACTAIVRQRPFSGQPGFAAAARRELWRAGGLYDLGITGAGDTAFFRTIMNAQEVVESQVDAFAFHCPETLQYFRRWALQVRKWMHGTVPGFVPGHVRHHFHGRHANRQYDTRAKLVKDISLVNAVRKLSNGVWAWNAEHEAKIAQMQAYFENRRDDEGCCSGEQSGCI